ncbi:MAG: hypothetical protein SFT92_00020 [Rickettsiales bacterium]|nr:hypothetical protein [Rickettsiales bacterium]
MKNKQALLYGSVSFLVLAGCSMGAGPLESNKYDQIDPKRNLSREDFRDFYNPNHKSTSDDPTQPSAIQPSAQAASEPPVPEMAEILATPRPPKIGETQLVSVAVTDDVPLKDVLIELARLADIDIEVDSGIVGGITFRAKDRPFNEVIDRISDLAGLRYTMKNNVLRVERDTPYVKEYSLNLLNIDRSSNNNIQVNTTSGGSGGSGGDSAGGGAGASSTGGSSGGGSSGTTTSSSGTNSGSSSSISGKSDGDFWVKFEESVKRIITYRPARHSSSTTIATQPAAAPTDSANAPARAARAPAATELAPQPVAVEDVEVQSTSPEDRTFYVINRQAGTMTVAATEKQHQMISTFLKKIEASSSAQVLIEAKIIEVSLYEDYRTGINWTKFGNGNIGFTRLNFQGVLPPDTSADSAMFGTDNSAILSIMPSYVDLNLAASFVETFGTTNTLSSPRLHATNNQQAVLSFAKNQPYFTLEIETTPATTAGTTTTGATTTVNSTLNTVPIGLILTLQPSINLDTNEVTLNVRPTLSSIVGNVQDPAATIAAAQADAGELVSNIPIVQVREVDSIMKVKSGQVMVIGGLMESKGFNTDTGVPGASSVPVVGNLFKSANKYNTTTELVILIRAIIVPTTGSMDNADRTVYEKYIPDPRPIRF